jgi:uncharacterized HAD superfamily protein
MTEKIIICDLDGTLCNCNHRLHLANKKDWDSFNELCINDKVNADIANIISNLRSEDTFIYLVSGRDNKFRENTIEWLRLNDIWYDKLLMRDAEDHRPDNVVKKDILDNYIERSKVWFVLDDRKSVVDMWRENGLRCLQVQEGDF